MISRKLICLGLLSTGLCLSACVSILPDPEPSSSVYRLSSNFTQAKNLANAEIVRVDRPTTTQVFNTSDIVVTTDGQKLSVIAQANWAEVAPVMIQSAMVDALASSPRFVGLIPTSGARTETRLHLTIQNFEASFDNGPESAPLGVVHYRVTYARADNRNLLGTYSVRKAVRAASINVSSVVDAIERANHAAMQDIVTWLESREYTGAS